MAKLLLLPVTAVFLLSWNGLAQSGGTISKPIGKPIGELLVNGTDGAVTVNGVSASWGSTIFEGSEIETNGGPAFVSFSGGLGAVSVAAGSKARFSIKDSRILAELLKGSLTVRSKVASQVAAPDRTVVSEEGNLYNVTVSPSSGTLVESLKGPLAVSMANGVLQRIAANGATVQVALDKPSPDGTQQNTPRPGRFAECGIDTICCGGATPPCRRVLIGTVDNTGAAVNGAMITLQLRTGGTPGVPGTQATLVGGCTTGPPNPPGLAGKCQVCFGANMGGLTAAQLVGGTAVQARAIFPDAVNVDARCFGP